MSLKFKTWLSNFWEGLSEWVYKYLGALVMDEKDHRMVMSIGRVMLLVLFAALLWSWRHVLLADGEIPSKLPPGMLECFYALLAYVLGGKGIKVFTTFKGGQLHTRSEIDEK